MKNWEIPIKPISEDTVVLKFPWSLIIFHTIFSFNSLIGESVENIVFKYCFERSD